MPAVVVQRRRRRRRGPRVRSALRPLRPERLLPAARQAGPDLARSRHPGGRPRMGPGDDDRVRLPLRGQAAEPGPAAGGGPGGVPRHGQGRRRHTLHHLRCADRSAGGVDHPLGELLRERNLCADPLRGGEAAVAAEGDGAGAERRAVAVHPAAGLDPGAGRPRHRPGRAGGRRLR